MTEQDDTGSSDDRRRAPRGRTFKSGKLLFGGFTEMAVDCLIVEASDVGLRVETRVMVQVPDDVVVQFFDGTQRRCRRRWAKGLQIGLEYVPG
jgi:hypothetical protein